MKRVYIFKDGVQQVSTATRESVADLIRQCRKQETHPILRAELSIIVGEEEFIPYPSQKKPSKRRSEMERQEVQFCMILKRNTVGYLKRRLRKSERVYLFGRIVLKMKSGTGTCRRIWQSASASQRKTACQICRKP